jgi:hypothetical protein
MRISTVVGSVALSPLLLFATGIMEAVPAHAMEPDGAPVLRMRQTPRFEQQPDGTWRASYAGVDWSVTAATRQAVVAALQAEDQRRVESDPEYRDFLFQLARRNLTNPSPDVEAEEITPGEYWLRTGGRERRTFARETLD